MNVFAYKHGFSDELQSSLSAVPSATHGGPTQGPASAGRGLAAPTGHPSAAVPAQGEITMNDLFMRLLALEDARREDKRVVMNAAFAVAATLLVLILVLLLVSVLRRRTHAAGVPPWPYMGHPPPMVMPMAMPWGFMGSMAHAGHVGPMDPMAPMATTDAKTTRPSTQAGARRHLR